MSRETEEFMWGEVRKTQEGRVSVMACDLRGLLEEVGMLRTIVQDTHPTNGWSPSAGFGDRGLRHFYKKGYWTVVLAGQGKDEVYCVTRKGTKTHGPHSMTAEQMMAYIDENGRPPMPTVEVCR